MESKEVDGRPNLEFKLPGSISYLLITMFVTIWIFFIDRNSKIHGIVVSVFFSLVEFIWVGSTILLPNGEVIFRPFNKRCRKPKTVCILYYNFCKILYLIFFSID